MWSQKGLLSGNPLYSTDLRIFFAFVILACLCLTVGAQNSDGQAAVYNIVSGSVIGGIGAIINKKPNDKIGKVFLNGACQGAIGGYLVFESKRLIRRFSVERDYSYVWPSRIVNAMGNSMTMNGAQNRRIGETWYLNLGFAHLNLDLNRRKKIQTRILPISFILTVKGFSVSEMDWKKSINTGLFVFKDDLRSQNLFGFALANTITYDKHSDKMMTYDILAHELIHVDQNEGIFAVNSYFNSINANLENRFTWVARYNKVFYTDFNHLLNDGLYFLLKNGEIYENEAFYYVNSTMEID